MRISTTHRTDDEKFSLKCTGEHSFLYDRGSYTVAVSCEGKDKSNAVKEVLGVIDKLQADLEKLKKEVAAL